MPRRLNSREAVASSVSILAAAAASRSNGLSMRGRSAFDVDMHGRHLHAGRADAALQQFKHVSEVARAFLALLGIEPSRRDLDPGDKAGDGLRHRFGVAGADRAILDAALDEAAQRARVAGGGAGDDLALRGLQVLDFAQHRDGRALRRERAAGEGERLLRARLRRPRPRLRDRRR